MLLVFWQALILTIAIETPIYCWFYKARDWRKVVLISILLNAVTLSFVWFIFYPSISDYAQFFIAAELYAFAAEAIVFAELLKKEGWGTALTASAIANAFSAGAGLVIGFIL